MANIYASEALDADFCDPVTVLRQVATVGSDGIVTFQTVAIQITASIQSNDDTLMMAPDLTRTEGAYEIITTFPLLTATVVHGADMVLWNGRQHRVISIGRFGNFAPGLGHYEGVMEIVSISPEPVELAMTPGALPLTLYRGDSYRWSFLLWTDAAKTQPADLTGVTPKAEIRDKPAGSTVVAMVCAIILPNTISMALDAAASAQLPPVGVWDLQLTYATGDVATVLAGAVVVTPDVTDSAAARVLRRVA